MVTPVVTLLVAAWSFVILSNRAQAQAPGLMWSTNIGARLFAVDSQTNVYANAGGTVIILNGDGVPLQTNSICPLPGLVQRDAVGDYYFAGVLPSHIGPSLIYREFEPQDFGGITLSNLPVYLVKYSTAGELFWATNFGPSGDLRGISVDDLALDSAGNILLSYTYFVSTVDHAPVAAKFSPHGSQFWSTFVPRGAGLERVGRSDSRLQGRPMVTRSITAVLATLAPHFRASTATVR